MKKSFKSAAAIFYEGSDRDEIPLVLASGEGQIADQMVRLARRYNVPVIEQNEIAETLVKLPLGSPIPQRFFQAVAAIFRGIRIAGRSKNQRLESD